MERRNKVILIVLALLIIAALVLYYLMTRQAPAGPAANVAPDDATVGRSLGGGGLGASVVTNVNSSAPVEKPAEQPATPVEPPKPDAQGNLRRVASAFAERYGTFSNTSNFENLLDLKAYMSQSMAAWADKLVADARAKGGGSAEYAGTTTLAVINDLAAFDEAGGTAEVVVKTQRRESVSTGDKTYYQDLSVKFIKEGEAWKVDSVAWKPVAP